MADQMHCLVTGATGYIGGRLAPALIERGHRVRAMARTPDKLVDAPWRDRAEVVRGDLGDPESLTSAFDGVDVVYYLVHSMGTSTDFVTEEKRVCPQRRRRGQGRRGAAHRLPQRAAPRRRTVSASGVPHRRRRHPDRVRHRDPGVAGGHRRRLRFGVVRDDPPPHRPAAGDDDAEVGSQQDPAHRDRRRPALPGRGRHGDRCPSHGPGTSAAPTSSSTARRCRSMPTSPGCAGGSSSPCRF